VVSSASWLAWLLYVPVPVCGVKRDSGLESPESRLPVPVGQSRLTGVPLVGLCTHRAGGTCKKKQRLVVVLLFVVPCLVEK
jgi:hypothetical protein